MDKVKIVKLYDIDLTERQSILREDIFNEEPEESFYIKFLKCVICYQEDFED
jgi:hypothetical protein